MYREITTAEFISKLKNERDKLEIIDVREPHEFSSVRIKGSKLMPMRELGERLSEIDWSKEVVFICRSGARSGHVANVLASAGYKPINLSGGISMLEMNCQECVDRGLLDDSYFEK